MSFNRTSSLGAIGLLVCLLATPSLGQGPLGFQIFAPADVSTYGGLPELNEGYFFQYDVLYWSISAPKVATIGYPGARLVNYGPDDSRDVRYETNTLDTSPLNSQFSVANRIEFGRIEDRNGWFVSIYQQRDQSQAFEAPEADINFNDPAFGPHGERLLQGNVNSDSTTVPPYSPPVFRDLPTYFNNVLVENFLDTWGVEANYLHRFMTCHNGGTFELFLGARYYEFNDNFNVSTQVSSNALNQVTAVTGNNTPAATNVPSFLAGSYWDTTAENHIVGPQIGLRWFKKQGRWTFSTEGRFMAGLNCQNLSQTVDMGPGLNPGPRTVVTITNPNPPITYSYNYVYPPFQPVTMAHATATYVDYERVFSPMVELRLEAKYQITRSIEFKAGWTGWWVDDIARANNIINYSVGTPAGEQPLGIDPSGNRQGLFVNGVTIGFTVNR
ncbi:MAG: BBP7 family outer membrane beta-barrel protein [Thermoguttaceae bacterium]|jgi:hypothetical protein